MHGIGTYAAESFDEFSRHFREDYRLIAPDWIGSGETTKLLEKEDIYGSRYCTDWLELLIPEAKKHGILDNSFSLFGISMSGLGIAESYPVIKNNLEKIIFLNPAGLDKRIKRSFAFTLSSGLFNPTIAKKIVNSNFLWKKTLNWSEEKRQRLKKDLDNNGEEFAIMLRHGRTGFTPFGRMRDSHYLPGHYQEIEHPILLIYGENDDIFYEQGYLDFARQHNWQTHMIEDAKHSIINSRPKEVAEAINPFLENQTSSQKKSNSLL